MPSPGTTKYNNTKRYWSHGWNAYETVCQDAVAWLRDGLMDELFPMMYFRDSNFFVTSCHLSADVGEVVSSLLCLRIHISVALNLYYVARHLIAQLLAA